MLQQYLRASCVHLAFHAATKSATEDWNVMGGGNTTSRGGTVIPTSPLHTKRTSQRPPETKTTNRIYLPRTRHVGKHLQYPRYHYVWRPLNATLARKFLTLREKTPLRPTAPTEAFSLLAGLSVWSAQTNKKFAGWQPACRYYVSNRAVKRAHVKMCMATLTAPLAIPRLCRQSTARDSTAVTKIMTAPRGGR